MSVKFRTCKKSNAQHDEKLNRNTIIIDYIENHVLRKEGKIIGAQTLNNWRKKNTPDWLTYKVPSEDHPYSVFFSQRFA